GAHSEGAHLVAGVHFTRKRHHLRSYSARDVRKPKIGSESPPATPELSLNVLLECSHAPWFSVLNARCYVNLTREAPGTSRRLRRSKTRSPYRLSGLRRRSRPRLRRPCTSRSCPYR